MPHSPGPWKWEDHRDVDRTLRLKSADGDSVLRIHDDERSRVPGDNDARVLAAAPELLDMVRWEAGNCDTADLACYTGNCRHTGMQALLRHIDGPKPEEPAEGCDEDE